MRQVLLSTLHNDYKNSLNVLYFCDIRTNWIQIDGITYKKGTGALNKVANITNHIYLCNQRETGCF